MYLLTTYFFSLSYACMSNYDSKFTLSFSPWTYDSALIRLGIFAGGLCWSTTPPNPCSLNARGTTATVLHVGYSMR